MLEDRDTREKVAHSSYTDMEQLDFQILLTCKYYINPNSIHICFSIKIKKETNQNVDIDSDFISQHSHKKRIVWKHGPGHLSRSSLLNYLLFY